MDEQKDRKEELFAKIFKLLGMYTITEIKYAVNDVEESELRDGKMVKEKLTKDEAIQIFIDHLNNYDDPIQLVQAFKIVLEGKLGTHILLKLIKGELNPVEEEMICRNIINMIGLDTIMHLLEVYDRLNNLNRTI